MNCPRCDAELRIGRSYQVVEDDRPVTVQEMMCPNGQCAYNRAGAPVRVNRTEGPRGEIPDTYLLCCDALLAKIGAQTYFVPDGVEHSVAGDTLTVVCPACGVRHTKDITGKSAFRA